ncbi:MAG: hypothetical protein ACK2UB_05685, partial [Anaerolineales bacterium]
LPVTTNTIILTMFISIILGAVAVFAFVKKKKQTGILALLILLSTLSLFLVKEGRHCFMAAIVVMVVLSQIYINSYKHAAQEK